MDKPLYWNNGVEYYLGETVIITKIGLDGMYLPAIYDVDTGEFPAKLTGVDYDCGQIELVRVEYEKADGVLRKTGFFPHRISKAVMNKQAISHHLVRMYGVSNG